MVSSSLAMWVQSACIIPVRTRASHWWRWSLRASHWWSWSLLLLLLMWLLSLLVL